MHVGRRSRRAALPAAGVAGAGATRPVLTPLNYGERLVAGGLGLTVLVVAVVLTVAPPDRRVALQNCPDADAGCIVRVDPDLTTFGGALAAIGFVAALIAILGVRFTTIRGPGFEIEATFDEETSGLARAEPQPADLPPDAPAAETPGTGAAHPIPIEVELQEGLGRQTGTVPVAVTRLTSPMREIDASLLRDYQSARRASQRSYFLTHILGPATRPGQKYSVAIKVTPHRDATDEIRSTSFYLGRAWGNTVYPGQRGPDGHFGIATEAHGPFLALCEVEFADGSRIVLDHYCDFEMGALLGA